MSWIVWTTSLRARASRESFRTTSVSFLRKNSSLQNPPPGSSRRTGNRRPDEKKGAPKGYEKTYGTLRTLVGLRPETVERDPLGVEDQPVHVEDHGRRAGQVRRRIARGPLSSLRHAPAARSASLAKREDTAAADGREHQGAADESEHARALRECQPHPDRGEDELQEYRQGQLGALHVA